MFTTQKNNEDQQFIFKIDRWNQKIINKKCLLLSVIFSTNSVIKQIKIMHNKQTLIDKVIIEPEPAVIKLILTIVIVIHLVVGVVHKSFLYTAIIIGY